MNLTIQNKSLFVLDDDITFHRLLTLANQKNLFRVSHHYQVRSILTHLWKHKNDPTNLPDVIFVDLTIPLYDGWFFLNVYQKIHYWLCKDIAIYVVTASKSEIDIERAASYSFVKQYITKPISMDKLKEIAACENYRASA
jgi:CheY-like chemotaxis protein